jgi:hypothetical protein
MQQCSGLIERLKIQRPSRVSLSEPIGIFYDSEKRYGHAGSVLPPKFEETYFARLEGV